MKRCRALALVFVLSSFSFVAHADDDAGTLAARQRFREGIEFFDKGQYDNARAAFLQAYALKKHPDILLNLAHTSLKAGHALEAYRYFKQFTTDAKSPPPDKLQDAQSGMTEALAALGTIAVKAPQGASVSVDGEALGATPLTNPIITEPGTHTVIVKLPDGAEKTFNIRTTAGLTTDVDATPVIAPVVPPPVVPPVTPPVPPPVEGKKAEKKSWAPVWIGAGVTVAAAAGATTMYIFKESAQSDANAVEDQIKRRAAQDGVETRQLCSSQIQQSAKLNEVYGNACGTLKDNLDKVDTNAMIGNIFLGVGIAGAVGTIVYGIIVGTHNAKVSKTESAKWMPVVAPDFRNGQKGVQFSMQF